MSNDILYTSDFTLEKYSNFADSGTLFLATSKHNQDEKYIIKHEYYDRSCNEYMDSKIGNNMGIKIGPVKLFVVDDKVNKFKIDYVCEIRYFENCEEVSFSDIKKEKEGINNWKDYFKIYLGNLKIDVEQFLIEINNKELIKTLGIILNYTEIYYGWFLFFCLKVLFCLIIHSFKCGE